MEKKSSANLFEEVYLMGSGFALIVVLFILLVIIGASYVGYGY
ncbi:YjcZ family sporulation protein [Bacillaceae bacterium IKA-2]|nr:YjcZ family sporulation protein [Bacillaceae bacterium IKA-2]